MANKELNALRLSLVRQRDSYTKQAQYLTQGNISENKTVAEAMKATKESETLRQVARDIDNLLYPTD